MFISLRVNGRTILRASPILTDDGSVMFSDTIIVGSAFPADIPIGCLFDSVDIAALEAQGNCPVELTCGISRHFTLRRSDNPADGDDLILDDGQGDHYPVHFAPISELLSPVQMSYLRES
ncbi:hypothetical protein ACEUZ9_004106 [Paracoccus litorisediminis]|uniref:hypothetical protein n=1 Tax=Paracoccus litorisediminis TaxID=2006130 RepID=UPI00372E7911